jgi:hypothetical protein
MTFQFLELVQHGFPVFRFLSHLAPPAVPLDVGQAMRVNESSPSFTK